MPRRISEHKALNHDNYLVDRGGYFSKPLYQEDNYKDYRLDNNRILRLRLLHPDKEEIIIGSDMIYEQFDLRTEQVRFVHLQYKMWEDGALYFSDERMMEQLTKLENNLCKSNLCKGIIGDSEFRLPYCSGFLRPTNKMQNAESKLVTSGIHVPICHIHKLKETEKKISRGNCHGRSISSKIFEEMFHSGMLGSRWISISELENFYSDKNLTALTHNIRLHAQEIRIQTEEEKSKNR